ncbi:MAG: hypothetical protein WD768_00480 [Phycisphaeraceae bacterium]
MEGTAWTFWFGAGAATLLGVWLLWRGLLRDRSRGQPRCPRCWYNLSGAVQTDGIFSPHACPECGRIVKSQRQLHRTRRRWWVAILGVAMLIATWYSFEVRHRMNYYEESFTSALVPTTALLFVMPRDAETFKYVDRLLRGDRSNWKSRNAAREDDLWDWQRRLLVRSLAKSTRIDDVDLVDEVDQWLEWLADEEGIGPTVADHYLAWLNDSDKKIQKRGAIGILWLERLASKTHALQAAGRLDEMLDDPEEDLRWVAVGALVRLGRAQFAGMSDEAFIARFKRLVKADLKGRSYDILLREMMARNTPACRDALEAAAQKPMPPESDPWRELQVMIARRQMAGLPHPVKIEILDPTPIHAPDHGEVLLRMRLTNVDVQKQSMQLPMKLDADGRVIYWGLEMRTVGLDAEPLVNFARTGYSSEKVQYLAAGKSIEINLSVRTGLPYGVVPDEYKATLFYHGDDYLSDRGVDVDNDLLFLRTPPMRWIVEPAKE